MNFNDYKINLGVGNVHTNGQRHSFESKGIVEATWNDDPASMIAYFYDWEHDDEKDKNKDLHPENSKTKIPIPIKYTIVSYKSLSKDEVNISIMFKPSYVCNIPYYKDKFQTPTNSIFPVGLFCDIKDTDGLLGKKGVWNRWLVVATADSINHDFPTWAILPCGYKFQWMSGGKKKEMWGVERSQNSYILCASHRKLCVENSLIAGTTC